MTQNLRPKGPQVLVKFIAIQIWWYKYPISTPLTGRYFSKTTRSSWSPPLGQDQQLAPARKSLLFLDRWPALHSILGCLLPQRRTRMQRVMRIPVAKWLLGHL